MTTDNVIEHPTARLARLTKYLDDRAASGPCEADTWTGKPCQREGAIRDEGVTRCRLHARLFFERHPDKNAELNAIVREVVDAERKARGVAR
jgi:hypothetical protein